MVQTFREIQTRRRSGLHRSLEIPTCEDGTFSEGIADDEKTLGLCQDERYIQMSQRTRWEVWPPAARKALSLGRGPAVVKYISDPLF